MEPTLRVFVVTHISKGVRPFYAVSMREKSKKFKK